MPKTNRFLLFMIAAVATMVLSGCGGGGGGTRPMTDGGSMTPDDGSTAMPTPSACEVGGTVSRGSSCSHVSSGNRFTFTVSADGTGCVGGICSGGSIRINNFAATRNDDGSWEVTALPGVATRPDDRPTTMTTDMAEAAARNAPNPGSGAQSSVTQSSNGSNGMTTDSVTTMVEYDNGQINFMVSNGSAWSISDDDTILARPSGSVSGVEFNGVELRKSLAGGTLWLDVYSDIQAPVTQGSDRGGEPVRLEESFGSSISGLTLDEINARMGDGELDGVPGVFSCDRAGGGTCPRLLRDTF